jgi:hypothetical protein
MRGAFTGVQTAFLKPVYRQALNVLYLLDHNATPSIKILYVLHGVV